MGELSLGLAQSQLANLVTGCEPSLFQARQVRNRGAQIANSQDVFHGVPIWLAGNAQSSRLLTGSLLTEQIGSLNYQYSLSTFQKTCGPCFAPFFGTQGKFKLQTVQSGPLPLGHGGVIAKGSHGKLRGPFGYPEPPPPWDNGPKHRRASSSKENHLESRD